MSVVGAVLCKVSQESGEREVKRKCEVWELEEKITQVYLTHASLFDKRAVTVTFLLMLQVSRWVI